MLYSKSTGGFYDPAINTDIPADAKAIPDAEYERLFAAQSGGQIIVPDKTGKPVAIAAADMPPIVPVSVTMKQARLALIDAGLYLKVQQAIGVAPQRAQVEWEFANTVERSSPIVAMLAEGLKLSDAMLDKLFFDAAAIP